MARAADTSIGAPLATKSFCMSTTIMTVFTGSMVSISIVLPPLSWTLADSGSIASYIDQDVACGGMDLCRITCPPRCLGIAVGPQLSPNVREDIAEGR